MKIKFIPKKQREQIKKRQEEELVKKSHPQHPQHPSQQKVKHEENGIKFENIVKKIEYSDESQNERSREKKVLPKVDLLEQQRNQRKQMKKKYLGLVKTPKSQRFENNYKDRLIFEWDNSQDTSGGVLNKFGFDSLKKLEKKKQQKGDLELGKSWKDKSYEEMTERDWRIFREDMEIYIKGGRVAYPFRQWKQQSSLNADLVKTLSKLKFQRPKPIQMQAIPIGIQEKDMVAIAPTGEGKTLAFLIPVLRHCEKLERVTAVNSDKGPHVLILIPSRELAEQIEDQFNKIRYDNITAARVVGGIQLDFQAIQMDKGCDILIGTPGRIKQMIQKHYLALMRCSWVVIDEADKMISENLGEDVEWILNSMSNDSMYTLEEHGKRRVTHMFSATMVPQIEKLTKQYLRGAVFVTIGEVGGGKKQIQQNVQMLAQNQKGDALCRILRAMPAPIIIFVNERTKTEKLCKMIAARCGRTAKEYHGGKTQEVRQNIIQAFREGKFQILVATDLGGRGLDIKGISAAISYDAPKNISEFIHRAGRSGRAGVKGKSFTFLTNSDQEIFYDVKNFLERNQFKVPEQLRDHPAAQVKPGTIGQSFRRRQIVYTN